MAKVVCPRCSASTVVAPGSEVACGSCGHATGEMLAQDGRSLVPVQQAAWPAQPESSQAATFQPAYPMARGARPAPQLFPYYQPHGTGGSNALAIVSLAFGIAVMPFVLFGWWMIVFLPWTSVVPLALAGVAVATGAPALRPQVGRGKAVTGMVLGIVGGLIVLSTLLLRLIIMNS